MFFAAYARTTGGILMTMQNKDKQNMVIAIIHSIIYIQLEHEKCQTKITTTSLISLLKCEIMHDLIKQVS